MVSGGVGAGRGIARQWWWLLACLLGVSCSRDTSVRTESVLIAAGDFYGLDWGGTQVERFYTVARPGLPADRTAQAVLVSPENDTPCSLGDNVGSYQAVKPRTAQKYVVGSPDPTRVMLFRDAYSVDNQDYGRLSFADITCRALDLQVPDVWLNRFSYVYSPDLSQLTYAVTTRERAFVLVDPWEETQQLVTRDVYDVSRPEHGFVLTEGESVVTRDDSGRELTRRGDQVISHVLINNDGDYAYLDKKGVFVVRDDKAKQVGPADACRLVPTDSFIQDSLAYWSPCETQHLVVASDKTGQTHSYVDDVDGSFAAIDGVLFFTTTSGTTTKLWMVSSLNPGEPIALTESEPFELHAAYALRPGLIALLAFDRSAGTYSVPSINLGDPSRRITVLTTDVISFWPTTNAVAIEYANGDLIVFRNDLRQVVMQFENASNMPYRFVFQGKAAGLAYLADFDTTTGLGRLELQLLNGDHFVLADKVRDGYREVWWPERGLLYTDAGNVPGIHFARVDIPCETTSDTAWACGF